MLDLPLLAKGPTALNVTPVAVLAVIGLWLRKLVKLAVLLLVLAAVVGAYLWMRGGL